MGAGGPAAAAPERRHRHPGRLRVPDLVALAGVLYVLRTGVAWRDVPAEAGGCSGVTAWRRPRDWTEAGVWPHLHAALLTELRRAGLLNLDDCSVDGSHVRALKGGPRRTLARRSGEPPRSHLGQKRLKGPHGGPQVLIRDVKRPRQAQPVPAQPPEVEDLSPVGCEVGIDLDAAVTAEAAPGPMNRVGVGADPTTPVDDPVRTGEDEDICESLKRRDRRPHGRVNCVQSVDVTKHEPSRIPSPFPTASSP